MLYSGGIVIQFTDDNTIALVADFKPSRNGSIKDETRYLVKDNDTLMSIAIAHYQDTTMWYVISEWNNLEDPLTLTVGATLKLPNFG